MTNVEYWDDKEKLREKTKEYMKMTIAFYALAIFAILLTDKTWVAITILAMMAIVPIKALYSYKKFKEGLQRQITTQNKSNN